MNRFLRLQYALTRFSDVINGRITHWNKTNLVASREISTNLDKLAPFQREVFTWFHAGAEAAIKMLLLERGLFQAPPLHVDPKKLAVENLRGLYLVMITYYTHIFAASNPDIADHLRDALYRIAPNRDEAESIFEGLRTEPSQDGNQPTQLSRRGQMFVWEKAARALGIKEYRDIALWYVFNGIALEWYQFAAKNIVKRVARA